MTAIANAYINALLADAAYVDLLNEPRRSSGNQALLRDRMTPTLAAAHIAANFEVVSSINTSDNPLIGSGFDAIVCVAKRVVTTRVSFCLHAWNGTRCGWC